MEMVDKAAPQHRQLNFCDIIQPVSAAKSEGTFRHF